MRFTDFGRCWDSPGHEKWHDFQFMARQRDVCTGEWEALMICSMCFGMATVKTPELEPLKKQTP